MTHHASPSFWRCYDALPPAVRALADKQFQLLKADHKHPSLHVKAVGRFRSARVGLAYRALAVQVTDGFLWFWIGTHDEYERIVA